MKIKKVVSTLIEIVKLLFLGGFGFITYLFLNKGKKAEIKQSLGKVKAGKVPPKKTKYNNKDLDKTIEELR